MMAHLKYALAALALLAFAKVSEAQISGNVAVEVTVLTRDGAPITGAQITLRQNVLNGPIFSTGVETDVNGFAALEATIPGPTISNEVDVQCSIARKRGNWRQTISLYSELQADRVYTRTVFLSLPKGYATCD
jgi:hypothetical protein